MEKDTKKLTASALLIAADVVLTRLLAINTPVMKIGLVAAFGRYDTQLAARFLGVEGGAFREGGRLSHYVKDGELSAAIDRAQALIAEYAERIKKARPEARESVFALLLKIFP